MSVDSPDRSGRPDEQLRRMIARRWLSAEQFYRERDHRTALEVPEVGRHADSPVEIHVDPAAVHHVTVQRIALVAANITARWARRVRVVVPDVPLAPPLARDGYERLPERIAGEMAMADPFGAFDVVSDDTGIGSATGGAAMATPSLRLFVGPWCRSCLREVAHDNDYVVMAWDWVATGRRCSDLPFEAPTAEPAAVSAAALAASLGVADLFKRAIGHPPSEWMRRFAWCTWRHELFVDDATADGAPWRSDAPPAPQQLDFGRTLLAGAGAIGSALIYVAALGTLKGELTVLDRDTVDTTNLNRSPLFTVSDALRDREKPAVVAAYLLGRDVRVSAVQGTWHEHAARLGAAELDIWVSLTNEEGAWAEVPFQLPPLVLHGTTTSGWGFSAGRHIPLVEDCTMCRMPRPEAEFRGPCAEGEIVPAHASDPARASLPFLSTAAAALACGELLKLAHGSAPCLPNDVAADLRLGLRSVVALQRFRNEWCRGCRALRSRLWESRGGRGRYAHLSMLAVADEQPG